jgi:hypothetical protein
MKDGLERLVAASMTTKTVYGVVGENFLGVNC